MMTANIDMINNEMDNIDKEMLQDCDDISDEKILGAVTKMLV